MAAITHNRIWPELRRPLPFEILTRPTALHERAFRLLEVELECIR